MSETVTSSATMAQPGKEKKERTFVNKVSRRFFLYSAATQGALVALLSTEEERPALDKPLSLDKLLYLIRSDIGEMEYRQLFAESPKEKDMPASENPGIAPLSMIKNALGKLQTQGSNLREDPERTVSDIQGTMSASVEYVSTYRLSAESAASNDVQRIDCNDHANIACERLSHYGIPMYLLSIWPLDPQDRFTHDWHQMAACKLDDDEYLILDNAHSLTHWHGSLAQFGREYKEIRGSSVPMAVIPYAGISRYVQAKYDCSASKVLLQIRHMTQKEDLMEALELERNYDTLARR